MITRPLDLSSKLRPEPRNFDWLFFVNAGLIGLFFALFGSRFVLAPGLGVDFQLPRVGNAHADARTTTHFISVVSAGQIFAGDGLRTMDQLGQWLKEQAKTVKQPSLLVRASAGVRAAVLTDITSAARTAGFTVVFAAEEPAARTGEGGR